MWNRYAFMLPPDRSTAPASDPPKGPYWVLGRLPTATMMLAFLPAGVELESEWSTAFGRMTSAVSEPIFHPGLVRPAWWEGPGRDIVPVAASCPPLDNS